MSVKSTGKNKNQKDRTDLKRLDQMSEAEIEEGTRTDPDTLLLEDCDLSTLLIQYKGGTP